jgi:Kef-type K+ transport system membrane component KefB
MEITILQEKQVLRLLVELFLLLFFARGLGELSRRLGQPAVVGEILGGILLGPTVLGTFWPGLQRAIFPTGDPVQMHMLEVFSWLGALFLLMVAGMEVDLSVVRKQGRTAFLIAVSRIVVSFSLGFTLGMILPADHIPGEVPHAVFAAFLGVACAVCAVPVLAKILNELGMLKSDIGLLTLSSSTL